MIFILTSGNDVPRNLSNSTVIQATQSLHGTRIHMTELQGSYKTLVFPF